MRVSSQDKIVHLYNLYNNFIVFHFIMSVFDFEVFCLTPTILNVLGRYMYLKLILVTL